MNSQPMIQPAPAPRAGAMLQPNWYAVYTYPKAEKIVCNKLREMGVEAFLPLHQVVRQWSDRKKKVEAPLFPNYVFVRTTPNRQFELCRIPELVRFVTCDDQPVPISEKVINDLKKLLAGDIEVYDNAFDYKVGERVKVVYGQFAGTQGFLVGVSGRKRLVVRIEVLQSLVSVEIGTHCVMPLA